VEKKLQTACRFGHRAHKSNFENIASALTICLKQREASALRRTALVNNSTILVVRR
jgi:hypothetical protein